MQDNGVKCDPSKIVRIERGADGAENSVDFLVIRSPTESGTTRHRDRRPERGSILDLPEVPGNVWLLEPVRGNADVAQQTR